MASPATTTFTSPKITFWTNHSCPWAQRVQITLKELGLTYEEVIIDLDKPRDDWYLKINPVMSSLDSYTCLFVVSEEIDSLNQAYD